MKKQMYLKTTIHTVKNNLNITPKLTVQLKLLNTKIVVNMEIKEKHSNLDNNEDNKEKHIKLIKSFLKNKGDDDSLDLNSHKDCN